MTASTTAPMIAPTTDPMIASTTDPRHRPRSRRSIATTSAMAVTTALALAVIGGCDRSPAPPPPTEPKPAGPPPLVNWLDTEEGAVVGIDDDLDELQRELDAATAQAHRTLAAARVRFDAMSSDRHDRWAIKWAAPVRRGPAAGRTEQVWIVPVRWTEHRIEGRLASVPLRPIGVEFGELIGIPVDEVVDWVHTPDAPVTDGFDGRREGGYTIDVLERRVGRPAR